MALHRLTLTASAGGSPPKCTTPRSATARAEAEEASALASTWVRKGKRGRMWWAAGGWGPGRGARPVGKGTNARP
jgi:hypothetical protein